MTILVTGGTGHIGRAIVEHQKTDGHRVRTLARHPLDDPTGEWVRADLGHSSDLASSVERWSGDPLRDALRQATVRRA